MAKPLPIAVNETLFGDFRVTLAFDNDPRTIGLAPCMWWRCDHCDAGDMSGTRGGYENMVAHARTHFPQVTPSGE